MTRSMKLTVAATAVVVLAGACVAGVFAQATPGPAGPGGRGHGPHHGPGFGPFDAHRLIWQLDLTDQQREQVRGILDQHAAELESVRGKLQETFRAQHDAVTAVPFDEGRIRAQSAELGAAQTEMAVIHGRVHTEIFQLLTPEQQAKAKQLAADRIARMGEMRERWHQHRGERRQATPDAQPRD